MMDNARHFSTHTATVQEEDTSKHSKESSSNSKFSSLKKRLRSFRRKKKADRGESFTSSDRRSDALGKGQNQGDIIVETPTSSRSSSLANEETDASRVDKFGVTVEDVGSECDDAEHDPVETNLNDPSKKVGHRASKSSVSGGNNSGTSASTVRMMKSFSRKGLPDPSMRHRAWAVIAGVDSIMAAREGEYDALVGKSRVDMKQIQECLMGGQHRTVIGQIEKDLKRTFPNHKMMQDISDVESASGEFLCHDDHASGESIGGLGQFSRTMNAKEGYGKKALRRILRAYSVYDDEVGYCQGMNFIAAMFLTFLPEEESFWTLVVVMNDDPYKLRDLFTQEMTASHEVLYIADKLVAQFLPELYEHLEDEQVHIAIFVTQWLMTIFTSAFPLKLVARVWDAFICDGWNVVYRTMIALLIHVQEELKARHSDLILSFLRGFQPTVDCDTIMMISSKIPLNQYHIQEHATEFRNLRESGEIRVEEVPRSRFRSPESIDGHSFTSSRVTLQNINKVHRFVSKLKRSIREISVEDLSPKLVPVVGSSKFALLLSNVLSPEECAGLIKRAKGEQFEDVLMRQPGKVGNELVEIGKCRRSTVEDLDLASELFDRLASALQGTEFEAKLQHAPWLNEEDTENSLTATGLNDRLHFLRFGIGQFFAPHRDSRFKSGHEKSHITMQVFLNHNFSGGLTSFKGRKRYLDVKPKTGSVLLFDQDLRREECEVFVGRKFIARSDVMFAAS